VSASTGLDVWCGWLNGLESAVTLLERQLQDGELPDVTMEPAPQGPLPEQLLSRARILGGRLDLTASAVQERRNTLAAELSRLAPPRPTVSSYTSWGDGQRLDICG
jgi:hypothetical protein